MTLVALEIVAVEGDSLVLGVVVDEQRLLERFAAHQLCQVLAVVGDERRDFNTRHLVVVA